MCPCRVNVLCAAKTDWTDLPLKFLVHVVSEVGTNLSLSHAYIASFHQRANKLTGQRLPVSIDTVEDFLRLLSETRRHTDLK